jgi:predicted phosphohydrolase
MKSVKYIREASDIHLDFDAGRWAKLPHLHPDKLAHKAEIDCLWAPTSLPEDLETVLLLPGDLWHATLAFEKRFAGAESWVGRLAKRFHSVIIVFGNHDYWDSSLSRGPEKARELMNEQGAANVYILDNTQVVIDNIKFLGGTLWTDFGRRNPIVEIIAPRYLAWDYKLIKKGKDQHRSRIDVADIYRAHIDTKRYVFEHAKRDNPAQKVVVLFHHCPSFQSINPRYHTSASQYDNFLYYSELDEIFYRDDVQIDLLVHGHTHCAVDYMLDRTRVICNPRGYLGSENVDQTGFNETLRLEVSQLRVLPTPVAEIPSIVEILDEEP